MNLFKGRFSLNVKYVVNQFFHTFHLKHNHPNVTKTNKISSETKEAHLNIIKLH